MATRIEKILKSARVTLADKNAERWSDDDLLQILDEGHKDLCRQTQILHDRADIVLTIGDPYFNLPADCWMITRVLYDDEVLPIISHTELDNQTLAHYQIDFGLTSGAYNWEEETGLPKAVIYDRRNLLQGKIFPIPSAEIADTEYTFIRPEDRPVEFAGDEYLGLVTEVEDYTFASDFGVVTNLFDPEVNVEEFISEFGVVTAVNEVIDSLRVYYIKNPTDLATVEDELETPYMFDTALKFYVVGHAFLNDINEEYQAKGSQQLIFYQRELDVASKTSQRDGTRAGQFETQYRGAF